MPPGFECVTYVFDFTAALKIIRDKLPKDYRDYGKWNDMLERVFRQSAADLKMNHLNVKDFSLLFIQLHFIEMVWTHMCKFVYGWKVLDW